MSNRTRKPRKNMSVRNVGAVEDIREMTTDLQDSYNSLSYYLRMHRACSDDEFEPSHGSMLHILWKKGHLSKQQAMAWQRWYSDMLRAVGNTDALHVSYSGSCGSSTYSDADKPYYGHATYWNGHQATVEQVWEQLRGHERGLIEQLFRDNLKVDGVKHLHAHDLKYLGNILSGYNDNRQKIAAGVSAIQRLLTSLAEIYRIPHFFS